MTTRNALTPEIDSPEIPLEFQRLVYPEEFFAELSAPDRTSPLATAENLAETINQIIEALRTDEEEVADDIAELDDVLQDHGERHTDGSDDIDGDQVPIAWTPSEITPDASPAEVDAATDLTAFLAGIDNRFKGSGLIPRDGGDLKEYDSAACAPSGAKIIPTHTSHKVIPHHSSPKYSIQEIVATTAVAGDRLTLRFETGHSWTVRYNVNGNIWPSGNGGVQWDWKDGARICELVYDGSKWRMVSAGSRTLHAQDFNSAYSLLAAQASADAPTPAVIALNRLVGRGSSGQIAGLTAATVRTILNVDDGATLNAEQAAEADLNQTISDPPTQAEVQAISDKVDAILAKLRSADILAT